MTYTYKTKGTCSRQMTVEVEDGIIKNVNIVGGCMGNIEGMTRLVKDRPVDEIIGLLKGVQCGMRGTSCPDQLACALEEMKANM